MLEEMEMKLTAEKQKESSVHDEQKLVNDIKLKVFRVLVICALMVAFSINILLR